MYHSVIFRLISPYNPNLTNKVIVSKNGTSAEYRWRFQYHQYVHERSGHQYFSGGAGINSISADAF
jgi:hypothetical protein